MVLLLWWVPVSVVAVLYEDVNIRYLHYSSHEYGSLDFLGMKSCVNGAIQTFCAYGVPAVYHCILTYWSTDDFDNIILIPTSIIDV